MVEAPDLILGPESGYPDGFHDFPQLLKINAVILS
jgi:hypothetical protein